MWFGAVMVFDTLHHFRRAVTKIVQYDYGVVCLEQLYDSMGANVASTAGDEYGLHVINLFISFITLGFILHLALH